MMKSPLMCGITAAAVTLFLLTSHTTVACYSQSPSTRPNQGLSDKVPGSKEYDQEVFLGKDIASEFHKQTTRETMRRLQLIVMKIDSNSDDSVDPEELRQWINATHVKFIQSSSDVHFTELLGELLASSCCLWEGVMSCLMLVKQTDAIFMNSLM